MQTPLSWTSCNTELLVTLLNCSSVSTAVHENSSVGSKWDTHIPSKEHVQGNILVPTFETVMSIGNRLIQTRDLANQHLQYR